MKTMFPDYTNSIVNFSASILNHFGADTNNHKTLPLLDKLLSKNYKNVVLLLLDGMGNKIVEKNFESDGLFKKNLKGSFSSVFPPTTVSATTSYYSGLTPFEHGWLGWDLYYPEIGKTVAVFPNKETDTENDLPFNVAKTYTPYKSIIEKINEAGGKAYWATPFNEPFCSDLDSIFSYIKELCKKDEKKFIFAYWNEPDKTFHHEGVYSKKAVEMCRSLETKVQELTDSLSDTLFLVTADHGQVDSENVWFFDYPKIQECLVRNPNIEVRTMNFYVKEGMDDEFIKRFKKAFGEKYRLFSKKEVIETKLFGDGTENPLFKSLLGDYIGVATGDFSIYMKKEHCDKYIGQHAGLTEDEMVIPLIAIEK